MILGEGAAAFLIEHAVTAQRRGARIYATVEGMGLTIDHRGHLAADESGRGLKRAIDLALDEAQLHSGAVDVLYGHGLGLPAYDRREMSAFVEVLGPVSKPICCVNGNTGVAEAASGLFSVAAAVLGMQSGEAFPIVSAKPCASGLDFVRGTVRRYAYRKTLVAGSTESGNNAAIVLSKEGEA
jgi:3-oxoacyl-(acyl-carrier-protein) synthase